MFRIKNETISVWDIWLAKFPFEDKNEEKIRPVIVIDVDTEFPKVLCMKVTGKAPRDKYDTYIKKWKEANLHKKSTARIAKKAYLPKNKFIKRIGELSNEDINIVFNLYVDLLSELKAKQDKEA